MTIFRCYSLLVDQGELSILIYYPIIPSINICPRIIPPICMTILRCHSLLTDQGELSMSIIRINPPVNILSPY